MKNPIVSREEWTLARQALLKKEKEFNRLRDELTLARRALPWTRVEKQYRFRGPAGEETLADLFGGRSQLVVYHFMFDPSWDEGCKSCSYLADNFAGGIVHLAHRDVTMLAVSRAPLEKIEAFRKRMGWSFKWVSSSDSDFNHDYQATLRPDELAAGKAIYNYEPSKFPMAEAPGTSVFYRDAEGSIFHTYSTYARGLDMLIGSYHVLDLVPKGR